MEPAKGKKPFITVKEAIISILVLLFVAIAFNKPTPILNRLITARTLTEADIQQFAEQLPIISAEKFEKELKESGKPTLLIIYTSWCPYCNKLMTDATSLKNEGKINWINLLPLSVDSQKTMLSRYVLQRRYEKLFTPYIMDDSAKYFLKSIATSKGWDFSRAIPYSIIFDRNGNAVESFYGTINKESLVMKLENAKNYATDK